MAWAGCKQPCVEDVGGEPTERDFSSLRMNGEYRCNLQDTCKVVFRSETSAVLTANTDEGEFKIEYAVSYGPAVEETLNVTQDVSADVRCGATEKYREETWKVPSVTFDATSATHDGAALDLNASVRILTHKAAMYRKLVVTQHFVDVRKDSAYVGVEVGTEPASYFRMPITRTGAALQIGPRS
jgi:hypothetical protein